MERKVFTGLLGLLLNMISAMSAELCNETQVFERGSVGRITCKFVPPFLSVRWYKERSEVAIAILERGKKVTTDGYDILETGDLVISDINLHHEGNYRVSLLDASGTRNIYMVAVIVTVLLSTNPHIERCSSFENPICHSIEEYKKPYTVVCQTENTRPEVTFVWSTMSSMTEYSVYSNSEMNTTTELFASYSVYQYDSSSLSLDYLTCIATGLAVNGSKNTSILVEGSKEYRQNNDHIRIKEGTTFTLKCATENFALRKWRYTNQGGNIEELRSVYPGEEGGPCWSNTRCKVNQEGLLTISDPSYKDEGVYECLYSNGSKGGRSVTRIDVIIAPTSKGVIVDECENSSRCEKNVDLKGTLLSSVLGARPQVKIMCEVGKNTDSVAFIYNGRTAIEENQKEGTFDTHYTIEYKIPECSKPVHAQCYVSPDSVHHNVTAANVYLITDSTACNNGKSGLTVVIVIIVIIVVALVITFIIYRKRGREAFGRFNSKRQINDVEISTMKSNMQTKENDVMQGQPLLGETYEPSKHASGEIQNLPDCTQEAFKEKFEPFIAKVVKKEGTVQEFNSLMETFCTENEVKQPASVILNFLMKEDDKDLTAIMEFLDEIKPNQWVSFIDIMRMLDELSAAKKLPGDRTLQLFEDYTKSNQINLTTFVNLTGNLLTSQCITLQSLHRAFRSIVESKEQHPLVLAEAFLRYHLLGYMSEEDAVKKMISFVHSNTIPLHYFFQTTYLQYGEKANVKNKPKLFVIFKRLLERMQSNAGESKERLYPQSNGQNFIKQSTVYGPVDQFMEYNNDHTEQDLSSIFIEVLICSIETENDYVICKSMLQSAQRNGRLSPRNYVAAILSCIKKKWITQDFQENILRYILYQKLVTDQEDKSICFQALLDVNGLTSFLSCLHSCNKDKSVNNTYFVKLVIKNIENGKIKEENYTESFKKLGESGKMTKEELGKLRKDILDAAEEDPEMETKKHPLKLLRRYSFPNVINKS